MRLISMKMAFYPQKPYLRQLYFFLNIRLVFLFYHYQPHLITFATLVALITHFLRSSSVPRILTLVKYKHLRDVRCEA